MIYLSPMVRSGYGETTFWVWFEQNFSNTSYELPVSFCADDVVLRYSTKGPIETAPGKSIALCWELLPEMKVVLQDNSWDGTIGLTYESAHRADAVTVASRFSVPFYEKYAKNIEILPIGVDTDLFKPLSIEEKYALRIKYGIPLGKEIGFWCGTPHRMKGAQHLQSYASENTDIYWIVVWYQAVGNFTGNGQQHFTVDQHTMAELMNCADFQLGTSILRPYYIIEYEGMACNLPRRDIIGIEKDFPVGQNTRDAIFENKWDRHSCKGNWKNYIEGLFNE